MKEWYYESPEGSQQGPVDESTLKEMLDSRRLSGDALVWSDGMKDWLPAAGLSPFAPSPYEAPAAEARTDLNWDTYEATGPQIRPWVRYWARTFDFMIFSFVAGFVLAFAAPELLEASDFAFGVGLLFAYNFFEPAMFALFGTTPVKLLLNVRIRTAEGARLGYGQALLRVFNVWIRGQGLGIPLVSLFTLITSYNRLTNQGITSWDQDRSFVVSHRKIEWWRWVILVGIAAASVGLIVLGTQE